MNDKEKYLFILDEITEQQRKVDEETSILLGMKRMLSRYPQDKVKIIQQDDGNSLPIEYNEAVTLPEKIYVALYKIQSGTVHDVVQSWLGYEPSYSPDKALKDARNYLSKLYNNKKINAKGGSRNKGYVYSIK